MADDDVTLNGPPGLIRPGLHPASPTLDVARVALSIVEGRDGRHGKLHARSPKPKSKKPDAIAHVGLFRRLMPAATYDAARGGGFAADGGMGNCGVGRVAARDKARARDETSRALL